MLDYTVLTSALLWTNIAEEEMLLDQKVISAGWRNSCKLDAKLTLRVEPLCLSLSHKPAPGLGQQRARHQDRQ